MNKKILPVLWLAIYILAQPTLIPYTPDPTPYNTPTLEWKYYPGTGQYKLEIDDEISFASPIISTYISGTLKYTSSQPLPLGKIYWHVSSDLNYLLFSDVDDFTIDTNTFAPLLIPYTPDPTPDNTPTLEWESVYGATEYKIEIDDDVTFTSPIISSLTSGVNSYTATQQLPLGEIYWHVSSDWNYEHFSGTDTFSIDTDIPDAPVLTPYTPDPTLDSTPTLEWSSVASATDYKIEIDDEVTFASPFISTLTSGVTSYTSGQNLSVGKTYWHVSSDIDYDAFSKTDFFIISKVPQLTDYPTNPTPNRTPTLEWDTVFSALQYKIEIDDDNSFVSPLISEEEIYTTHYKPTQELPLGSIFWRVSSDIDYLSFSSASELTIDTTVQTAPSLIPFSPESTDNRTPTLQWNSVLNASDYKIEIDEETTFLSPIVSQIVSGATSLTPSEELPLGKTYWHVSSDLEYDIFSEIDDFTIVDQITSLSNNYLKNKLRRLILLNYPLRIPENTSKIKVSFFDLKGKSVFVTRISENKSSVIVRNEIINQISNGLYIVSISFQDHSGKRISEKNLKLIKFSK